MSNIEVEINTKEFKDKLGIKDVDMTPILESISSLKKELKKTPTSNNKEVLNAIKLITSKKSDNSDIIKAIDSMASKIVIPEGNKDLILRFDKLVDVLNSQGLFRPNYNSYNPQIRNKEGIEINPATEEKQDTIIEHVDSVETLLGNIETNQTDGSQKIQVIEPGGTNVDFATSSKQDSILTELQQKTEPTDIQLGELIPILRSILIAIANPSYVDKSVNQTRSQITGSLTTVTNLTNLGSFSGDYLQRMNNMTAWSTNIRNLIT